MRLSTSLELSSPAVAGHPVAIGERFERVMAFHDSRGDAETRRESHANAPLSALSPFVRASVGTRHPQHLRVSASPREPLAEFKIASAFRLGGLLESILGLAYGRTRGRAMTANARALWVTS